MALMTDILALATLPSDQVPATALEKGRLSLLDWMVCGWAGRDEPLARKLRSMALQDAGAEVAHLFNGGRVPPRMAALVNGSISHALDFDDTHFGHVGHLSVGIYPAVLAIGEETGASVSAMVEAFVIGAEAAIRIGIALGAAHYNRGFHQTATAGAFGATVAAARLYGLDRDQTRAALGLCATCASGLRSQFGTMGKPLNAGLSASNGVECVRLAALGMSSAEDGLSGPQGFIPTHTDDAREAEAFAIPVSDQFLFEDNKYKFHACCHGTHAMIEGLLSAVPAGTPLSDVARVTLDTSPRWLTVCDKKAPTTGLEVKFSYAWLAGMTLRGDATGDDRAYTDALAADGELAAFARNVVVIGNASLTDLEARGTVEMKDGRTLDYSHDLAAQLELSVLREKLQRKAVELIGERGQILAECLDNLDRLTARDIGLLIAGE